MAHTTAIVGDRHTIGDLELVIATVTITDFVSPSEALTAAEFGLSEIVDVDPGVYYFDTTTDEYRPVFYNRLDQTLHPLIDNDGTPNFMVPAANDAGNGGIIYLRVYGYA